MPTNKMSLSSPAPVAKYCPGIENLCAKKYEFGPFWGQSVLRKQARDELCSICDTFRFFDPKRDYKLIYDIFQRDNKTISENDYNKLCNDIYRRQREIVNDFLARVRDDIERYKNTNYPTITVAGIRRMYDKSQKLMDDSIYQFADSYVRHYRKIGRDF